MSDGIPHGYNGPLVDLSCKGLAELPALLRGAAPVTSTSQIRELNLAFNEFPSLLGIVEACPGLERLGAAHNQLRTLPKLSNLMMLCRLDLSHNRLSDISSLSGCRALGELWLASNALELPALLPLGSLGNLRDLVIAGNPCVEKVSPTGLGRHVTLLLLPNLSSLDARPVGDSARAEAATFMQTAGARAAVNRLLGSKQALRLLRAGPAQFAASRSGGGGTGQPLDVSDAGAKYCPPRRRRLQQHQHQQQRRHPVAGGGSSSSMNGSGSVMGLSAHGNDGPIGASDCAFDDDAERPMSVCRPGDGGEVASGALSPGAGIGGGAESAYSGSPSSHDRADGSTHGGSSVRSGGGGGGGTHSGGGGRTYGVSGRQGRTPATKHGSAEVSAATLASHDAAMVQALARVAESEQALAAARAEKPVVATDLCARGIPRSSGTKTRFGRRANAIAPTASVPASETEMLLMYPRAGSGNAAACVVRADGSCVVRWPSGGVAILVDRAPNAPLGFSLSASYGGSGRTAAAFDGHGCGFAYRPDGTLVLTHDTKRGGSCEGGPGGSVKAWRGGRAQSGGSESGFGGESGGGGESSGGTGAGGVDQDGGGHAESAARLCVPLGECMAVLFTPPTDSRPHPTIAIAFKCDGFQHLVHQAVNPQHPQWDPTLDTLPAVRDLLASSRPRRRLNGSDASGSTLPAALTHAGGPRSGLGGIADALSLLPDLKGATTRVR